MLMSREATLGSCALPRWRAIAGLTAAPFLRTFLRRRFRGAWRPEVPGDLMVRFISPVSFLTNLHWVRVSKS
eukprot:5137896-Pyramimonas_sp.AAC.1